MGSTREPESVAEKRLPARRALRSFDSCMELFGELRGPESVALQNRVILLCSQLSSNLPKQRVSSLTCTLETKQSCRSPFEGLGLTMICRQKSWGSSEIQRWISQMTRLAGSGSCFCSGGCRAYQLSQKRCPAVCGSLALPHNVEIGRAHV